MTNNDADQRTVLPLVSVALIACASALFGLPEDLVNLLGQLARAFHDLGGVSGDK
jgi:hypothetical protein